MWALLLGLWAATSQGSSSFEIETNADRFHVTADRTLYHSREKVYEAFGRVVMSARGQRLSSDYLWFDSQSRELKAKGNVVFVDRQSTIQAAEIHFNLESGTGSVFYGKVSNDQYSLRGQLIRRISSDRFLTTEGEYTTCRDCAESWKLSARNVDLTIDGYAFMDNVYVKLKDVPTLYVPYLILPVKTRRQTGLLFPRFGVNSNHGFVFVQPLFLAISDHQDATISAGKYSSRGLRYEFEHRFKFKGGWQGTTNLFHTKDRKAPFDNKRSALLASHVLPVSDNLMLRLRVIEALDRNYVEDFPEDISGRGLPNLESNFILSAPFPHFFFSAEVKRYRNLLYQKEKGFDGGMVQAAPTLHLGLRETPLFGPVFGSLYGRFDRFKRHNGSIFDANSNRFFDPNEDLIREADRWILQPEVAVPFSLGGALQVAPSLQFSETGYLFRAPLLDGSNVSSTNTRYLLGRMELSSTFDRVWNYDGERVSKVKHQLTPFLTFNNIPWIQNGSPNHPFNGGVGQIGKPNGIFDQFDVVPLSNSTNFLRFPQGKSIFYGFNSRLIRKLKTEEEKKPRVYPFDREAISDNEYSGPVPKNRKAELAIERDERWKRFGPAYSQYEDVWTVSASQAYDFKQAKLSEDRKRAFSYLLGKSSLNIDRFSHDLEYRYFPRLVVRDGSLQNSNLNETVFKAKHFVSTSLTYRLADLRNLRGTRSFVRTISAGFTNSSQPNRSRTFSTNLVWSLNDLLNVKLAYNYDLLVKNQLAWSSNFLFTHSSECWGLSFQYDWQRNRSPKKGNFDFQILVNLLGTGFFGFRDQAQSVAPGFLGGN
jgi:lipopolysaccharide assembly outer membrane protein LptD (OstA)